MKSLLASLFTLASISSAHADCASGRWVTPEGQTRKCITSEVDPSPKGACEIKNSKGVISWYRLKESKADCDAQKGVLRVLQDDPEQVPMGSPAPVSEAERQRCKSKCRYPDPPTLVERMGWLRHYYCRLCDGYHLTSQGAKRVVKIEKPKRPMVLRGGYELERR